MTNAFTTIAAQIAQAAEQAALTASAQVAVAEIVKPKAQPAPKFGAEYGEQILHSYGCHAFERMVDGAVHFTIVRQAADDKGRKCNAKKFFQHMIERSKLFKVGMELIVTNFIDEKEMVTVEQLFDSFVNAKAAQQKLEALVLKAIELKKDVSEYLPAMDDMEEALDQILSLKKISALQHYVVNGIANDLSIAEEEMNNA